MAACITGTGSALPERIVQSFELATLLGVDEAWIVRRTGIKTRRYAAAGQTSASLAVQAARQALASANIVAADLGLIVCATVSPDQMTPSNAAVVQAALGSSEVAAFDLSAACSGFLYALVVAERFIRAGEVEHALVLGAEVLSRSLNFSDRTSCILFGDGAGAAVLSKRRDSPDNGILYADAWADGSQGSLVRVPGPCRATDAHVPGVRPMHIAFDGHETFRFAVRAMVRCVKRATRECDLSLEDISAIIPHQVNYRVFEAAMEQLSLPLEKLVVNIERVGNTGAASVPIALDEAANSGRLRVGDIVLLVAFGGGLTWSAAVVRWCR